LGKKLLSGKKPNTERRQINDEMLKTTRRIKIKYKALN
jgi:hypothetical protein